jgi:hypothetical protein
MADPAAHAQAIVDERHKRIAVKNIGENRSCSTLDKHKARTCDAEV